MDPREQSDQYIDGTDSIKCYENGKTWQCECGQGNGTTFEIESFKCPTCGKIVYDRNWNDREPPSKESGQATLSGWT